MGQGPRLVIGDFDRSRGESLQSAASEAGFDAQVCGTGAEVIEVCQADPAAVVVLEVFLPKKNGFEVLKLLKEEADTARTKVILMLDADDDYGEHRARLCGADAIKRRPIADEAIVDVIQQRLQESNLEQSGGELGAAVISDTEGDSGPLGAMLNAMEGRARAENPLLEHITDPLTGLFNEPYMQLKLAEEYKKARRFGFPLTCARIAMDDEGVLADPENASTLRSVLNEVAGLLLCESRDIDHLARQDVKDFFLLLPHTDAAGATAMIARVLKSIEGRALCLPGGDEHFTASAGLSCYKGDELESAEELSDRCTEALEASRKWGGNRLTLWTPNAEKAKI